MSAVFFLRNMEICFVAGAFSKFSFQFFCKCATCFSFMPEILFTAKIFSLTK
ncbi:hypothetical protein HMPREF3213_01426 [Heyndrickxia coagulans]|uniref:Uncharacterized protein n=1 Tax=Heyndrickxia coagulans TaxID=1398 RepID=A0A133KTW9_HEYCO|nr:hypothetical protein HMPREF3213_01426 [Heyndrickxia coagulans]